MDEIAAWTGLRPVVSGVAPEIRSKKGFVALAIRRNAELNGPEALFHPMSALLSGQRFGQYFSHMTQSDGRQMLDLLAAA